MGCSSRCWTVIKEVTPLPPDAGWQIQVTALMIGVRALARTSSRPPSDYQRLLVQAIRTLVGDLASSG